MSTSSVPMLCLWLKKHILDEATVISILTHLERHAQTGPGCQAIETYLHIDSLVHIVDSHRSNASLCLLLLRLVRRLVDCNLTRDILLRTPTVVDICKDIGTAIAGDMAVAEQVVMCLMKCCCCEGGRQALVTHHSFLFMKQLCQRYVTNAVMVRGTLKYCNWACSSQQELKLFFEYGAVGLAIKSMRRHSSSADVMRPGVHFLYRSCESNANALAYLLRKSAVSLIVRACSVLANDEEFLAMGLKLVRQMSHTKEGWEQLEGIPGAWQSLCQGSMVGNSLVHDLEGDFANKGWCIGDMKYPPIKEKQQLLNAAIEGARARTRVNWSVRTLRDYMKTSSGQFALAINLEYDEAHFEILSSLDLLPVPGELREDWYIRLFKYEKSNEVRVEDMVRALLEIRKRELSSQNQDAEQVKPIFVAGELVTAESLELQDLSAEDAVRGYNADDLEDNLESS